MSANSKTVRWVVTLLGVIVAACIGGFTLWPVYFLSVAVSQGKIGVVLISTLVLLLCLGLTALLAYWVARYHSHRMFVKGSVVMAMALGFVWNAFGDAIESWLGFR